MVLLIDTSGAKGQLVLAEGTACKAERSWLKEGSHSEKLTLEVAALFADAGATFADIMKIAVVTGPGSFTGLRVGINCAKTLAYSLQIPVVPINALFAIACGNFNSGKPVISLLDAQRNSIFLSEFSAKGSPLRENRIVSLEELEIPENSILCGAGWTRYRDYLQPQLEKGVTFTNEWPCLHKLLSFLPEMTPKTWSEIQPLYIRKSAAEEKLN